MHINAVNGVNGYIRPETDRLHNKYVLRAIMFFTNIQDYGKQKQQFRIAKNLETHQIGNTAMRGFTT